jgi:aspartate 1-decarboxylase
MVLRASGADCVGHRAKETPMLRTFVSGKIHRIRVSALNPMYNGSCLICPDLLTAAGIRPFEKVEIYSLTSAARIATYVFPGAAKGEFALNGGAALHFSIGDQVAIVAYRREEHFSGAECVIVDPSDNSIARRLHYEQTADSSAEVSSSQCCSVAARL